VAQTAGGSEGRACTGAKAAQRDGRVVARGRSASQAPSRSILIAAAVAPGWTCVLSRPRERVRRRPKARPPWDRGPSPPARRCSGCGPSALLDQARALWRASSWAWGGTRRRRPCWRDWVQRGRTGQGRHCGGRKATIMYGWPARAPTACPLREGVPWGPTTVWGCQAPAQGSTDSAPAPCVCQPWIGRVGPRSVLPCACGLVRSSSASIEAPATRCSGGARSVSTRGFWSPSGQPAAWTAAEGVWPCVSRGGCVGAHVSLPCPIYPVQDVPCWWR
jgi:hypothetical protein